VHTLADRYQLRRVIGRGGLGRVWAARDLMTGREVAVKTSDHTAAERLRREAALIARVDHPGVVDVLDTGEDGQTVFYVMELLPGRDLSAVLRDGPLPAPVAVQVAAGLADILHATHRSGVVHGDVKPANVVLTDDDVVLVDFGAAATTHDGPHRETVGTAPYMAPEQVTCRPLTPATDLYSLGCLLVSALAGRPPFWSDSPTEVLRWQVRAEPPRLRDLLDGVPERLEELVGRLLRTDPAHRGSAAAVRDALRELQGHPALAGVTPRATVPPVRVDPQATMPALTLLTTARHCGPDHRLPPRATTGGAAPTRPAVRRAARQPEPGRHRARDGHLVR